MQGSKAGGSSARHRRRTRLAFYGEPCVDRRRRSYRGVTRPSRPFGKDKGWGAWELAGRYGVREVDDAAFPLFASADVAARRAEAWTFGVNEYPTSNLKRASKDSRTRFDRGAVAGAGREGEKAVFSRLQVAV